MKGSLSKININSGTVVLSAILLSGLFLRLHNLGGQSLWLDEVLSVKYANLNMSQIFLLHDTSPPIYYILLHWWTHLFGISEASVRFPSVICGFLSILMMYKIGKRLFDANTGQIGALLMAFSVFHIQYSQEARTYSLSVLLTILSMYYFIKLLDGMNGRVLAGYVTYSTLLIYSHIYGLFIIIAQNIYFFCLFLLSKGAAKVDFKKWFSIQFLLVLLFTPWLGILLHEAAYVQNGFWIPRPHISIVISTLMTYSSGSRVLLLLCLAILPFSVISYEQLREGTNGKGFFKDLESYRWKICLSNTDKFFFLLLWLITPIILPLIVSRSSQPIYVTKYTIVASSAFFLLVAAGMTNLHNKTMKSTAISIVIATLVSG